MQKTIVILRISTLYLFVFFILISGFAFTVLSDERLPTNHKLILSAMLPKHYENKFKNIERISETIFDKLDYDVNETTDIVLEIRKTGKTDSAFYLQILTGNGKFAGKMTVLITIKKASLHLDFLTFADAGFYIDTTISKNNRFGLKETEVKYGEPDTLCERLYFWDNTTYITDAKNVRCEPSR